MKTTKFIGAVIILSVLFVSPNAQSQGNQLFYGVKYSIKPDRIDEFIELEKKFITVCKENNYQYSFSAWRSNSPDYYFFYPVKDYNEINDISEAAWALVPKLEEDFAKRIFETIESMDDFFLRSIDSLAYNPGNGLVIGEDLPYAEWWINYHKTWTGGKYRNTFKKGVEMQKKANYDYPIFRFQAEVGMNQPALISVFWGKDAADLYAHMNKNWENLGEEVQSMINDFDSTTRKFEKIPFWFMSEISYSAQ